MILAICGLFNACFLLTSLFFTFSDPAHSIILSNTFFFLILMNCECSPSEGPSVKALGARASWKEDCVVLYISMYANILLQVFICYQTVQLRLLLRVWQFTETSFSLCFYVYLYIHTKRHSRAQAQIQRGCSGTAASPFWTGLCCWKLETLKKAPKQKRMPPFPCMHRGTSPPLPFLQSLLFCPGGERIFRASPAYSSWAAWTWAHLGQPTVVEVSCACSQWDCAVWVNSPHPSGCCHCSQLNPAPAQYPCRVPSYPNPASAPGLHALSIHEMPGAVLAAMVPVTVAQSTATASPLFLGTKEVFRAAVMGFLYIFFWQAH